MIECLTHTKLKFDHEQYEIEEDEDEDEQENKKSDYDNNSNLQSGSAVSESIVIHNSGKKMQKKQFLILHQLIRELCHDPLQFRRTSSPSSNGNMNSARGVERPIIRRSFSQDDNEFERPRHRKQNDRHNYEHDHDKYYLD